MGLAEAFNVIDQEKPEKKTAEKRYVTFSIDEWRDMEKAYGSGIEPGDVKALIQGIFQGTFDINVRAATK